jgi:hypothetical protein
MTVAELGAANLLIFDAGALRRCCCGRTPVQAAGAGMLVISSCICLLLGARLAALAPRRCIAKATMEEVGGGLILAGLCLLGAGLPLFR